MEIRRWVYYVAVNCALVCYIVAEPFSLNKLIESELNRKEVTHTTISPKIEESKQAAERFSLNKGLKPLNRITKKFKETGAKLNLIPLGKISPLKFRKTFQIKSPLKPKRVKSSLRIRQKRKNQSIKREIDGNAILNKKYVPLLRSLGMLFDNILGTDSGESPEKTKYKKRLRYYPVGDKDVSCKCPRQGTNAEPYSEEETVSFSETLAPEVAITTEVTAETTDNPSAGNLRGFRQHKNVPLLFSRNSFGAWRNNHGISERGRPAHNGSAERDISGNNGDSEHDSKRGQEQSYAESDEEHTDSDTRNDASHIRTRGSRGRRLRGREYRNNTEEVYENDAISKDEAEIFLESREGTTQYNGSHKFETERDKAKSGKLLSEPIRGQRGFLSNDEVIDFAESVQSEENDEESVISIAHDSASDQRLADGDGPHTSQNKKANTPPETLIHELPYATNRYLTKYAKPTAIKKPTSDLSGSEQNSDYGGIDVNISYDISEQRSSDIDDSNSTEARETNATTESEQQKEPVLVQPRNISKKIKEIIANSAEVTPTENKEEKDSSIEHDSLGDQLDGDNNYSTRKQTSAGPDKVYPPPAVENSLYFLKPKKSRSKGPVAMIIDGYSVTRHKNGENKLAEKSIRIRP